MSDKPSYPPITDEQVRQALGTIAAEKPAARPTRSLSSLWVVVPAIAVGFLLKAMGWSEYAPWVGLAICAPFIVLFVIRLRQAMREQQKR